MGLEYDEGHLVIEEGGRVAMDTRAPMMNLMPEGAIVLDEFSIYFPNFWFGIAYQQNRLSQDIGGDIHSCFTLTALVEQEWGPTASSPNNLPNQIVGTVPEGTDYLEVWVNIQRTLVPDTIMNLPFTPIIPEGQWIKLEGGSCMPEKQSGIARLFEFVLEGTNVVLKRYQSVRANGGWTRIEGGASAGSKSFYFARTNAPNDSSKTALLGTLLDFKLDRSNPTHRPEGKENGSNNNDPCSISGSGISYESNWKGAIRITPGRITG